MGGDTIIRMLMKSQVRHEMIGSGAVPMLLAGREVDRVAGANDTRRLPPLLRETLSFCHVQDLAHRMSVPSSACPRSEVHQNSMNP